MDRKTMLAKYSTYYSVIENLAKEDLFNVPSVDKVFQNKSLMQKAYLEAREIKFPGRVTDYISWISTAFLVDRVRPQVPEDATLHVWVKMICDQYDKQKVDVRNFLRMWCYCKEFFSLLECEIYGEEYASGKEGEDFLDTEKFLKSIKTDVFLSAMVSFAIYDDINGKMLDGMEDKLKLVFEKTNEINF